MVAGGTVSGLAESTTRSASLPGSIEPLVASSPYIRAPSIVIASRASSGPIRSFGPSVPPDRVVRLTAVWIVKIWSSGETLKSVWFVGRMPRLRADFIGLMKAARSLGIRPTNHTDFNVSPLDQIFTIHTAVNRTTRSGVTLGPDERISPLEALEAITIDGARMYGEQATKGSIEPGKLADLVVLSANPLTVPPATIKDIRVEETIKEGRTVWLRTPEDGPR